MTVDISAFQAEFQLAIALNLGLSVYSFSRRNAEDGIAAVMRVSDKRIRAIKRERQRVFDENGSASNKEKLERANDADKKYTALKDRYFPYRRRHREMDRYFIIATAISSIYSIIFLFNAEKSLPI